MQTETIIQSESEIEPVNLEINFEAAEKPVVVITGSTGLIGSQLVEAFSAYYRVVGLDLKTPQEIVADSDFIVCDMTKDESVRQAMAIVHDTCGDRMASVIHLAAYYDFSGNPSPLYRDLTIEGTRRLLREMRGFKVEQFVFSSTLLVMKPVEDDSQIISERSPLEPESETWDYPRSKLEAERVIGKEHGQIPTVILRIAGVYDEDCRSIPIAQQISRIYQKTFESYFFPGDADHGQPFVHLNDLADCFLKVVELRRELRPQELFLIAEPDVMSYSELQDRIGQLIHGQEWPTIRIPKVVAKAGAWVQEKILGEAKFIKPWMIDLADTNYPVEIERARLRLGWEPGYRLRNTLGEMILRLKRNPQTWYALNKLAPEEEKGQDARAR